MMRTPTESPHGPLHPAQGQGQQDKGDKIGNHERAATITRRNTGKTKKIP
jgi:hypothetical protein